MLNAKKTPARPSCLTSSGLTVVLIHCGSYMSDAGNSGFSGICMQSKAKGKPSLEDTLGNVYPLSDGN